MVNERRAGAVLSYVALVINAIGALLYVPILLSVLSAAEYGVYQMIGSIIAYLSVMDMGLSTTLNRYYVRTKVRGVKSDTENMLSHAAIIYGLLTFFSVLVGLGFYFLIDQLFGASFTTDELNLAHQMMVLVIINCIIILPGNWFLAIINASERFVFARTLSMIKYVLQIVSVVSVLQVWSSAMAVLVMQVIMNMLVVAAYIFYVKKKLGIRAKFHYWDGRLVRNLFAFSFLILLNMVFDQVFWKTGQLVLGAVMGATAVGVYGIVCQLITSGYMQVSTGVASVFLPRLTAISALTDDMLEINNLFCSIGRIQAILVWGMIAGFAVLGKEFICLWAGPEYGEVYPAVLILMVGLCICLTQNLGISVLQAKNKMGFRAIVYAVLAALDLIISIPVSASFGVIGCSVVAASLLFIGTGPVMNIFYYRTIGINIPLFYKQVLPLILPVLATGLGTRVLLFYFPPVWSWLNFVFATIAFMVIYFAALWCFGFNNYEKGLFRGILKKYRKA